MCDLETSRIGAPYIYDISSLRVNLEFKGLILSIQITGCVINITSVSELVTIMMILRVVRSVKT